MGKIMRFNQLLGLLLLSLLVFQQVGAVEVKEKSKFLNHLEEVDNVPYEIEEGLFLGSFASAMDVSVLKGLNITHVLTVAKLPSLHPEEFRYKTVKVDNTKDVNLSRVFHQSFAFIDEARKNGGGVLVHCLAGVSRSATVVVGYMMNEHGMSLSEALKHVKSIRPVISPNPGFMRQLEALEKSLVRADL